MHRDNLPDSWTPLYQDPRFHDITRQRRRIVMTLFVVGALFYFSIPAITTFYPALFHVRLFGAINLGLLYSVLQYPIGGLIAWAYARGMRRLDQQTRAVMASLT